MAIVATSAKIARKLEVSWFPLQLAPLRKIGPYEDVQAGSGWLQEGNVYDWTYTTRSTLIVSFRIKILNMMYN